MQVNHFSRKLNDCPIGSPPAVGPMPSNRVISSTQMAEAKVTATALSNSSLEICRLRITTCLRPNRVDWVAPNNRAKLVVLIPPPVPPGLAPMNISRIINSKPASERLSIERGTVLKPAVRVVID